jgi:hypothetical protein
MVKKFYEEKMMKKKRQLKLVQAGEYVAEVKNDKGHKKRV